MKVRNFGRCFYAFLADVDIIHGSGLIGSFITERIQATAGFAGDFVKSFMGEFNTHDLYKIWICANSLLSENL